LELFIESPRPRGNLTSDKPEKRCQKESKDIVLKIDLIGDAKSWERPLSNMDGNR